MSGALELAQRYLSALSAGDVDAVVACVSEGFVNEHTSALGTSSTGADAYRERLPAFLAMFDQLHYELVDAIADEQRGRVAARYRMTALYADQALDIPGVMLFTVRDGAIAQRTDVWDSLTFLRQTGQM